jgi:hypothetical protein
MDAAPATLPPGERTSGSGLAAAPGWLALAAAPTFAAMAVWSASSPGSGPPLCTGNTAGFDPGGMPAMYLLMAVFHASPWLRALRQRLPCSSSLTGSSGP